MKEGPGAKLFRQDPVRCNNADLLLVCMFLRRFTKCVIFHQAYMYVILSVCMPFMAILHEHHQSVARLLTALVEKQHFESGDVGCGKTCRLAVSRVSFA
jgi:hypothetical protein